MANNVTTSTSPATVPSGLPAPVPFKDVVFTVSDDRDAADASEPEEYASAAAAAALPSNPKLFLRRYQGTWVLEPWVPGIVAIQRGAFAPRRGDVVIASAPMCGAPWLKALAFAAMARGVHPPPPAGGHPAGHHHHHPLLFAHPDDVVPSMEKHFGTALGRKAMDSMPSPRLMATQMHHSILPASVADNPDCKIVYICRDPKDMLVSMWQFSRRIRQDLEFSDLLEAACDGSCLSGPIWEHVLGYWNASQASPKMLLFLRYEEMLRDPVGNVVKLARFLGRPFSPAEEEAGVAMDVVRLCSKLKDVEVNMAASGSGSRRGGEAGRWENHMTPEMARRVDAVMEEKLRGSGFSFC